MDKIRVALIGLGFRGVGLYDEILKYRVDTDFIAFCDIDTSKCEKACDIAEKEGHKRPLIYSDYKKCIDECKPDVVIISTSWIAHLEVCMYSMERGIITACEVGGAYTIELLWDLVHCYERTQTPICFLENCCYGRLELLALNMKRLGLLGEIVHCEGGYRHDLRHEIASGIDGSHYRYQEYMHRNCDNYPTHGIGPIAKLLDINCGNKFLSIYSMASKSSGMARYSECSDNEELKNTKFLQGDVVTSLIKCQNGETITLTLDTTLPRYYSRGFVVQGTKGMLCEEIDGGRVDGIADSHIRTECVGNIEKMYEKYEHPLWKKSYKNVNVHGGIDERIFDEFFNAVKEGRPMPIDVYDMATWMSITILSEQSITIGQSVSFPDFTNGAWVRRKSNFLK